MPWQSSSSTRPTAAEYVAALSPAIQTELEQLVRTIGGMSFVERQAAAFFLAGVGRLVVRPEGPDGAADVAVGELLNRVIDVIDSLEGTS